MSRTYRSLVAAKRAIHRVDRTFRSEFSEVAGEAQVDAGACRSGAMKRNWIFVSVPVVAAIVLDDQLTKAAATQAGRVAHNPSYALGVVGGPAVALIAGTVVVLAAFLLFVARPAVAFGVSPIAPALIVGGMFGNA